MAPVGNRGHADGNDGIWESHIQLTDYAGLPVYQLSEPSLRVWSTGVLKPRFFQTICITRPIEGLNKKQADSRKQRAGYTMNDRPVHGQKGDQPTEKDRPGPARPDRQWWKYTGLTEIRIIYFI
jgi:hypothetical protein